MLLYTIGYEGIQYEELFQYPYIFVECTFIYGEKIDSDLKHIYWDQIKEIIVKHSSNIFVLIHFSVRYTQMELTEFFKVQNLKNVIISN